MSIFIFSTRCRHIPFHECKYENDKYVSEDMHSKATRKEIKKITKALWNENVDEAISSIKFGRTEARNTLPLAHELRSKSGDTLPVYEETEKNPAPVYR